MTGAGGAIGAAIARVLVKSGWQVVGIDLRFAAAGDDALDERCECDIADSAAFRELLIDVAARHRVRGLVNCAGICPVGPFFESDEAGWRRTVDVNFMAPLVACHTIVPLMVRAQEGRVVNVTSEASRTGASGVAVYSGTKGGLLSFSKSLAQEVAHAGVTVNCVSPGTIDTPMTAPNADMAGKLVRKIPLRRLGQPEDVAGAVGYLASPEAGFVTGQVLSVGGGLTMIG